MLDLKMVFEYFKERKNKTLYGHTLVKVTYDIYDEIYKNDELCQLSSEIVTLYFEIPIGDEIFKKEIQIENVDSTYFDGTSVHYELNGKKFVDMLSGVDKLEKSIKTALNHTNPIVMKLDWR